MLVTQPLDNCSWVYKARFFFIQLLAGRSMVILNAKIEMIEKTDEALLEVGDIDGGLVDNNTFVSAGSKIHKISQVGSLAMKGGA